MKSWRVILAAGLTGVPAVTVQDSYLAPTQGNFGDLPAVIERLVERARTEAGIRQCVYF